MNTCPASRSNDTYHDCENEPKAMNGFEDAHIISDMPWILREVENRRSGTKDKGLETEMGNQALYATLGVEDLPLQLVVPE